MIGPFVSFTESLGLAGCRTKELNPPERATEFMASHLNLSDEQSRIIVPLAENLFAKKEDFLISAKLSTTKLLLK
jgi:hypothetical protein